MYADYIVPFSEIWWKTSGIVLIFGIVLLTFTLMLSEKGKVEFSKQLGTFLLFDLFFFEFALYYMGAWDMHWALPLQYCTIMEFLAAIALMTRWQSVYEAILFLGIIGPLQALIAPAFPYSADYFFYEFYVSHTAPIFTSLFLTLSLKMRPREYAWLKSSIGFICFGMLVLYFNYRTGSNYMFLMEKPSLEHPFLGLGEWPDYLVIWAGVLIGWSFLINLCFLRKSYTEHLG